VRETKRKTKIRERDKKENKNEIIYWRQRDRKEIT
jgi:hypothetical protein